MQPATTPTEPLVTRLLRRAREPVDGASLGAHRVLFGTLMACASLRFLQAGWVDRYFVQPTFFLHYHGFEWVAPLPRAGMITLILTLALFAALVALGIRSRLFALLFALGYAYVELLDATNYLNHHYLVFWLALLHAFFPTDAALALCPGARTVPRLALYVFRAQVGLVYFFAAVAKVGPDFLLHGQPVELWFSSRTEIPLIGPLLMLPFVPLMASWAGFLNDLLAGPLLAFDRTRKFGFLMVFTFHGLTGVFFDIGIFPALMMVNATLFLDADWPRRLPPVGARLAVPKLLAPATPGPAFALAAAYLAFHALFPLRSFLYGGNVLWHEQGMRYSWRVMLRHKTGDVVYRVVSPNGRTTLAYPHTYLTPAQERELVGQPDLILALAHHVGRQAGPGARVYADAVCSLNGRRPARLIDPSVDLMQVEDGIEPAGYIMPAPSGPPLSLFVDRSAVARSHAPESDP